MRIPKLTQGLLHSIIGPQTNPSTGAATYATTQRNKNVIVDKICIIVLVLPTKSMFKHLKNMPYTTLKISMGPYARGTPDNWPAYPCVKTALI